MKKGALIVGITVVLLAGGIFAFSSMTNNEEGEKKIAELIVLREKLQAAMDKNESLVLVAVGDRVHTGADRIHDQALMVINELENIQNELLQVSNGHQVRGAGKDFHLEHPLDRDKPTWLMLGEDPGQPTGRAVELRRRLEQFRNIDLAPGIPLEIDLSPQINGESWERANFYKKPLADVLAVLVKMETAVIEAENTALEKGIFVNE